MFITRNTAFYVHSLQWLYGKLMQISKLNMGNVEYILYIKYGWQLMYLVHLISVNICSNTLRIVVALG